MSEPAAYLATNPTHPSNTDALVWEPENWHITWEFKPLYLHPDPRIAELEAVLRECREALVPYMKYVDGTNVLNHPAQSVAKIDEVLNEDR